MMVSNCSKSIFKYFLHPFGIKTTGAKSVSILHHHIVEHQPGGGVHSGVKETLHQTESVHKQHHIDDTVQKVFRRAENFEIVQIDIPLWSWIVGGIADGKQDVTEAQYVDSVEQHLSSVLPPVTCLVMVLDNFTHQRIVESLFDEPHFEFN